MTYFLFFLAGTPITRWHLLLWGPLETLLQEMTFRRRCVCVSRCVCSSCMNISGFRQEMDTSSSLFLCPRWCWTAPLSPASCTCSVAPRNPSGRRRAGPSPTSQRETEHRFRYTLTHTPHLLPRGLSLFITCDRVTAASSSLRRSELVCSVNLGIYFWF